VFLLPEDFYFIYLSNILALNVSDEGVVRSKLDIYVFLLECLLRISIIH